MRKLTAKGFTLVELMVVVAIIGILSAVAIPNFKKYQAKSKTSEAKLQLAAIYSAESALQSDFDAFAECLSYAGWTAPTTGTYYGIGFSVQAAAAKAGGIVDSNAGAGTPCSGDTVYGDDATKKVGGQSRKRSELTAANIGLLAVASDDGGSFVAGALGAVDSGKTAVTTADAWTIDEDKALIHFRTGY